MLESQRTETTQTTMGRETANSSLFFHITWGTAITKKDIFPVSGVTANPVTNGGFGYYRS